jgi:cardiolipin synthase
MSEPIFTVANQLTMVRMALVPAFVLLVLAREFNWALVVFVVAGVTDALDGWVARHTGQITRLGQMLDPVADKLLAGSAYVLLTWSSAVSCPLPAWLTVTLLFRDGMLVVAVVIVNLTVGPRAFAPSWLGKASTACIVATGCAVLAANAVGECPSSLSWLYVATLVVLVASTAHYVYQASERPRRASRAGAESAAGEPRPEDSSRRL